MSDQDLPGPILFPVEDQNEDQTESSSATSSSSKSRPNRDQVTEFLSWDSPSRLFDAKSPSWFLGVFFIGLLLIIACAIFQEIWLALFVAATIFVLYALARVPPADVNHRILSTGIETANRLYIWKDLKSFWVYNYKGATILRLDTSLYFPHVLELLLPPQTPTQDIQELEDLLSDYLPLQPKPISQAGPMTDNAILSIGNKLPGRAKMLKWLAKNLGIK